MKHFLAYVAVVAIHVSSPAVADQCWCTCTSAYKDCADLDISWCKKKDDALVNCTCLHAVGSCPPNAMSNLEESKEWIEALKSNNLSAPISLIQE